MIPGFPVLTVMAVVWAAVGLFWWDASPAMYAGPVLLSALIYAAARRPARKLAPRTPEDEARIGKMIGFWSMVEGVVIAPVALVLANTGERRLVPAAIAIVVGLHFLPIARATPRPLNYATGGAMIAAGVAGLWVIDGGAVALACAGVLWVTCLIMIVQAAGSSSARVAVGS